MGDSWSVAHEAQIDAYGAGEAEAALVEALHQPNCSERAPVSVADDGPAFGLIAIWCAAA
jgi:hypothetical protein